MGFGIRMPGRSTYALHLLRVDEAAGRLVPRHDFCHVHEHTLFHASSANLTGIAKDFSPVHLSAYGTVQRDIAITLKLQEFKEVEETVCGSLTPAGSLELAPAEHESIDFCLGHTSAQVSGHFSASAQVHGPSHSSRGVQHSSAAPSAGALSRWQHARHSGNTHSSRAVLRSGVRCGPLCLVRGVERGHIRK